MPAGVDGQGLEDIGNIVDQSIEREQAPARSRATQRSVDVVADAAIRIPAKYPKSQPEDTVAAEAKPGDDELDASAAEGECKR